MENKHIFLVNNDYSCQPVVSIRECLYGRTNDEKKTRNEIYKRLQFISLKLIRDSAVESNPNALHNRSVGRSVCRSHTHTHATPYFVSHSKFFWFWHFVLHLRQRKERKENRNALPHSYCNLISNRACFVQGNAICNANRDDVIICVSAMCVKKWF